MTAAQFNTLADTRESYGDTREALELRQKAKKAVAAEARLADLIDSRDRTAEALARNIGTITEQDWRDALARCDERVKAAR